MIDSIRVDFLHSSILDIGIVETIFLTQNCALFTAKFFIAINALYCLIAPLVVPKFDEKNDDH